MTFTVLAAINLSKSVSNESTSPSGPALEFLGLILIGLPGINFGDRNPPPLLISFLCFRGRDLLGEFCGEDSGDNEDPGDTDVLGVFVSVDLRVPFLGEPIGEVLVCDRIRTA